MIVESQVHVETVYAFYVPGANKMLYASSLNPGYPLERYCSPSTFAIEFGARGFVSWIDFSLALELKWITEADIPDVFRSLNPDVVAAIRLVTA